jgi:hypothetical protein
METAADIMERDVVIDACGRLLDIVTRLDVLEASTR